MKQQPANHRAGQLAEAPSRQGLVAWVTLFRTAAVIAAALLCLATDALGQIVVPLRITCPPDQTNWMCGVNSTMPVTYPTPTVTGANCPQRTVITCSPPSGGIFILGTTTVTCTATNSCGQRDTCTFRVTVARDTTPPVIQCPSTTIATICGTASTAPVNYPIPTATDNADTNVTVTCVPPPGTPLPAGVTTVNCVATDDCTNRSTCTFIIDVVRDATPPSIQCPPTIITQICNSASVVVNYPTPTATDNFDPSPTVVCTPSSGKEFPPGITTVTCTATDDCGNTRDCTFRIVVNADLAPPVISCPSNIVLWTCDPTAVTHYAVTATDDLDSDVTLVCVPPAGTALPVGVTTVVCTARDDCGKTSQCTFDVRIIRDTTPPEITCPSNLVFNCICPGNAIALDFFNPEVVDNHDPNPTIVCVPPSLISSPGVHPVVCTATDNCGNSNRCSFTVTFNYDTTPPVITCPTNMNIWTCSNLARVTYSVTATDNCTSNVSLVCTPPSGSLFPVGNTTVACVATDNCTNRSTCTFTVTVNRDATPPSLTCPPNVVASICSTCAVSQCVANVPMPIRPASVGNGLFYGSSVEPDLSLTVFNSQMAVRAEDGYHPIHVNAYQPPGETGIGAARFAAAWVRDDDSAFPFDHGWAMTANELQAEELAQQPLRPISLSGYKMNANTSRFAVAYLRDDSGYPWQLILDRDSDQYQAEILALAAQGYRPICVSGYSFHGVNPRFSGIFVQDGLTGSDWVTRHGIPEEEYHDWIDGWWEDGFRPISLSAYTAGNQTYFTAVMVRVPGSGGYVARHGLTEAQFLAENAMWTNPANNEFNTTFRPVVVAAYESSASGGARRFAAVWRGSASRAFSANGPTQPSLAALDTAMQGFMQLRDVNAATLCVSKDGSIVHHRGYNWSPAEFKETQPCSRFRIASAAKPIAAIAVMKILEGSIFTGTKDGGLQALTLDIPVFQINGMPDLPAAYGAAAQNITIRQLLQHRAGWVSDVYDPFGEDASIAAKLGKSLPLTRQDVIDYMMTPGLWPTPGNEASVGFVNVPDTVSAYSNFGFAILARLVEVFADVPYETYVRQNILLPVGAHRTRIGYTARLWSLTGPEEVTYTAGVAIDPRWYVSDSNYDPMNVLNPTVLSAVGTGEPGAAFPTSPYGRSNVQIIDGPGGWVATSDDLVRLLRSFDGYIPGQNDTGTQLLDYDSLWEMWSNPANSSLFLNDSYFLGWQQGTLANGVRIHYHRGDIYGAMALIGRRDDGVTFAAMFSRNAGNGSFSAINNAIDSITSWPFCPEGTVVNYDPPVATDNADANVSVVCVPPSGSYFEIGSHSIKCTATDDCGNQKICEFRVTVKVDNTPPSIQCPTNVVAWANCDSNGTAVNFPLPSVDDDSDANPSVVCTPPSGSVFPVGRTVVTCTATDDCTNRSTCTFTVTVNADTVRPFIVCPTNQFAWSCGPNGAVVDYALPEVFDNRDPNPSVVCVPPPGSTFPNGVTTVSCTARDNCDNTSTCTFTIQVRPDTTPPVLHCPTLLTVLTCTNYAEVDYRVNATDDCDPQVEVVCTPPAGSRLPLGVTAVTCVARDDCGNSVTCVFDVSVRRIAPQLSVSQDNGGIVLTWPDNADLETAAEVAGPYTVEPDARSPFRVDPTRRNRFFRAVLRGGDGTTIFCPDGEETNPRLTDVLSRLHYASTHGREEFEEYEDVSVEPVTSTPTPRSDPYDPRPGSGYSWNSSVGRRFLLDIGDAGDDHEGEASHAHGSVEWQISQAADSPYCVTPTYYVEAGDRVFSGWSEMTFKAPGNAFATKAEAEAFLLKVHAEQPFFLPFTDPDVKLGHGWYYNSGGLHRACDYSRSGVEEDEDPTFLVTSAGNGVVVATDWDGNGGNYVAVESTAPGGQKVMFIYLHLRDGKSHDIAKAKSSTSDSEKYVKYRAFANDYPDHISWGTEGHTIKVAVGDPVSIGTPLAWAGNTGAGGAGSGLNEDGSPKNWKGNTHLHVYVAVPHPTLANTWVWVDPYGVYQEVDTGCYDLLKDTKFSRLYAPFFSTFHGVPYEVFKHYWGYYPNMGRKLRTLSIHRDGNSLLASGSFQSGIPGGWYLHTYRTSDQFQELAELRFQQGYIMRETTVEKTLGGEPRFSAIWRPLEPGESIEHRPQLTDAQWSDLWQDRVVDDEWRLEDYFGYSVNGVNYQSAFVTSHEGRPFLYSGLLTSSAFDDKIDEYKADGFLPVQFNAASRAGGLRFSGIFRDLPGCWKVRWGLTPAQYQTYVSEQIGLGYRVWKVQGYADSNRYGVVLHDPTGPCQ